MIIIRFLSFVNINQEETLNLGPYDITRKRDVSNYNFPIIIKWAEMLLTPPTLPETVQTDIL